MLNLGKYRRRPQRLPDYLPWAGLVAPGVLLDKDGSFQATIGYRGPDLDSATPTGIMTAAFRLNHTLRRFGSGWCLHLEARRREATGYPPSAWPSPAAALIDDERRALFLRQGQHYETDCFLTLTYLPPAETMRRVESWFIRNHDGAGVDYRGHLERFVARVAETEAMLASFMPVARRLDDDATLGYLHGTVSTRFHPVACPELPFYLDHLLADCRLTGGFTPTLGGQHLRTLSIRGYPTRTAPGMLEALDSLPLEYRYSVRWLPMGKAEAARTLMTWRKHWWARRKGIGAVYREAVTQEESVLLDSEAETRALDVEGAQLISELEDVNAVEAWLGSLPGQAYADVRRAIVSSLNLCHLLPLSSVWAGMAWNRHLDGPPVLTTITRGNTPFRVDLFQGDVGHTAVVGPTGAGKSTLLALLTAQWLRHTHAQVFFFDKGRSSRCITLALGGDFLDLGQEGAIGLQPLANVDDVTERAWAVEWLTDLVARERVAITPEIKTELWAALATLAAQPRHQRTLTVLKALVQTRDLREALEPFTLQGAFGHLLDAETVRLGSGRVLAFEMEALMEQKTAVAPVRTAIFRLLERRLSGAPTLLVLDEAWLFLDDTLFGLKIRDWLKSLRKRDVAVVFATQSLADITASAVAPAVIESCLSRIFLPNERATESASQALYERFGLNPRQLANLAAARPKRDYYYQSAAGNRLFELGLGPVALALCGSSRPEDHRLIDRILASHPREDFTQAYLHAKGLGDALPTGELDAIVTALAAE